MSAAVRHIADDVSCLLQGKDEALFLVGLNLGEDVHSVHLRQQRVVAHPVKVGPGEEPRVHEPDLLTVCAATRWLSPMTIFSDTPRRFRVGYRVGNPRLGRVEEPGSPQRSSPTRRRS
jgi:hypothetical protein